MELDSNTKTWTARTSQQYRNCTASKWFSKSLGLQADKEIKQSLHQTL